MSVAYTSVGWNRNKRRYDAAVIGFIVLFVGVFCGVSMLVRRPPSEVSGVIMMIRALGTCAIVLLHVVLWVGPACRLDPRLLPLLYNRRHLGVMTFLVALAHGLLALIWYHGFGVLHPLVSLLTSNSSVTDLRRFPFEVLGLAALLILFLMAATSHDFWLRNLSPRVWRTLHSLVYAAYFLLVMHVTLGALQSERPVALAAVLGAGALVTIALRVTSGVREWRADRASTKAKK